MLSGPEFPVVNCYLIWLFQIIMVCFIAKSKTGKHTMPKVLSHVSKKFTDGSLTVKVWEYFYLYTGGKRVTVGSGVVHGCVTYIE